LSTMQERTGAMDAPLHFLQKGWVEMTDKDKRVAREQILRVEKQIQSYASIVEYEYVLFREVLSDDVYSKPSTINDEPDLKSKKSFSELMNKWAEEDPEYDTKAQKFMDELDRQLRVDWRALAEEMAKILRSIRDFRHGITREHIGRLAEEALEKYEALTKDNK